MEFGFGQGDAVRAAVDAVPGLRLVECCGICKGTNARHVARTCLVFIIRHSSHSSFVIRFRLPPQLFRRESDATALEQLRRSPFSTLTSW